MKRIIYSKWLLLIRSRFLLNTMKRLNDSNSKAESTKWYQLLSMISPNLWLTWSKMDPIYFVLNKMMIAYMYHSEKKSIENHLRPISALQIDTFLSFTARYKTTVCWSNYIIYLIKVPSAVGFSYQIDFGGHVSILELRKNYMISSSASVFYANECKDRFMIHTIWSISCPISIIWQTNFTTINL